MNLGEHLGRVLSRVLAMVPRHSYYCIAESIVLQNLLMNLMNKIRRN